MMVILQKKFHRLTGSNQDLYLDFPHYNQNIYYNND